MTFDDSEVSGQSLQLCLSGISSSGHSPINYLFEFFIVLHTIGVQCLYVYIDGWC